MPELICPKCNIAMTERKQPDLTVDSCPKCEAVYLHKGELNSLATGMSGDIEYCSIDNDFHKDIFPIRNCPLCKDHKMEKINLLRLSNIIFDYCPRCQGFFLDKGEVDKMNRELREESPKKSAEEYRARHGAHLVRIDQTDEAVEVSFLGVSRISKARYIRVSVFPEPEPSVKFHITQEVWALRLLNSVGLHFGNDIKTGDNNFDAIFRVHSEETGILNQYITDSVRKKMVEFVSSNQSILGRSGSLDVANTHIVYVEGPYTPESIRKILEKSMPVIDRLVEIADAMV